MPTIFTHAVAGLALGTVFEPDNAPTRFWIAGAACAMVPDLDWAGAPFGLHYEVFLGDHRGFTHSLLFAVLFGSAVVWLFFRAPKWRETRLRIWLYLMLATASHGFLDAFTSYGEGVAFLSPFSSERFFAPWRPFGTGGPFVGIRGFVMNELLFG
jgi:inner membrane protein